MPPIAVTLICVALFAATAWILLGHRELLGAAPGDRSEDPFFQRSFRAGLFGFILIYEALGLWRRVLLAWGRWEGSGLEASPVGTVLDTLPLPANALTLLAGTAVAVGGIALRVWATRVLGRFFTFEIGIRTGHDIVESGPYRLIRHPSYTGLILLLVGICLAYANGLGLLVAAVGTLAFFSARIRAEEAMLVRHFGPRYVEYQARTKRLIPFVY